MDFIPKSILEYSEEHSSPDTLLLDELYRETNLKVLMPEMISGHLQGRFLSMVSKMVNPKRILEIGTYTGYSTLAMAEGLPSDGLIFTVDHNEELTEIQNRYWNASPFKDQIIGHTGNASNIIPTIKEKWDLVFIDADKQNYLNYYEMVLKNVNSGSIILADNVLWYGKVTKEIDINDADTLALDKFNKFVRNDERVEVLLMPFRDGLSMIRKK